MGDKGWAADDRPGQEPGRLLQLKPVSLLRRPKWRQPGNGAARTARPVWLSVPGARGAADVAAELPGAQPGVRANGRARKHCAGAGDAGGAAAL